MYVYTYAQHYPLSGVVGLKLLKKETPSVGKNNNTFYL